MHPFGYFDEPDRVMGACGAVASLLGTIWAFAVQAVELLFGVPIQVVLASATAAFAARTYVGSSGFLRTLGMTALYGAIGAWTVPLMLHLLGFPTSVSAGVAMLISGGIQLPAIRERVAALLGGLLGQKGGGP